MNKKRLIIVAMVAVMLLAVMSLMGCKNNANNEVVTEAPTVSAPAEETAPQDVPAQTQGTEAEPEAEPETQQTEAVDNEENDATQATEETKQPEETVQPTEPNNDVPVAVVSDYQRYHNMSGEEQQAFIDGFESIEAFFEWYNAAKAEHERLNPGTEIGSGNIDLGDLAGGNG